MNLKILVLYYTQSGQLQQILSNLLAPLQNDCQIDYCPILPEKEFPFPWTPNSFFDAMPETVLQEGVPVKVKNFETVSQQTYDLVILGYQPWFLHPSQPTMGFLKSQYSEILKNKKVLTVIGSRNMWLNAQEVVKRELQSLNAQLVGNILFQDRHTNLVSLLTIIRWNFKGQKEAKGMLPEAGVSTKDIQNAARFAPIIKSALQENNFAALQNDLVLQDAVVLDKGLVLLEQRGVKNFRKFARYIKEKGGPGDPNRLPRVKLFQRLLLTAIFVLSPLSSISAFIKKQLNQRRLKEDLIYFKSVAYTPNKF